MTTTASKNLNDMVLSDISGRYPPLPQHAINILTRETKAHFPERPHVYVVETIKARPELAERLTDDQRESLGIMVLSRMLAASLVESRSGHVLDGERLKLAWKSLGKARALFPEATQKTIRALARQATVRANLRIKQPSRLAQALLYEHGRLSQALANGGLK